MFAPFGVFGLALVLAVPVSSVRSSAASEEDWKGGLHD
jgi:hypothetical protein